jgi:2-dehydropantoate 2-reductase
MQDLRIGFLGAGAIGGYLGIRLSAAGYPVVLVGRSDLEQQRAHLTAIDMSGREHRPAGSLVVATDASSLQHVDVCLVTVKSVDTAQAGALLKVHPPDTAIVVSLQNGIRNPAVLAEASGRTVVPGMVTFNVRREPPGRFRKATSGPLMFGRGIGAAVATIDRLAAAFRDIEEPTELRTDMGAVQLTKLLLNLNNGLCAVTGLSVADSLRSRPLRRAFSACMKEGIAMAHANGLPLTRIGPLAPALVARLLTVPDFLFFRLARSMMAIDPAARSSTLQDIDRGRPTEIDYLSGEIVALARKVHRDAPANRFVTEQVHQLERAGRPPPFLTPEQVWDGIQRRSGQHG